MAENTKPEPYDIRERAFQFALRIVRLCQHLDSRRGVAQLLSRQVLKSGTSIGANLEEAHAGQSKADFINKNAIALKEARETVYWLKLIAASNVVSNEQVTGIFCEAQEISAIIGAIVVSSKKHRSAFGLLSLIFPFAFFLLP